MKLSITIFLFIISQFAVAQRFYPSASTIFMNDEFEAFPLEFEFLESWCTESSSRMFIADLQHSVNPRNSASFNSLALIVRKDYVFDFLNTGLEIRFVDDTTKKVDRYTILNNNYWKIINYYSGFSFKSFDPEDNGMNFLYCKLIQNITDNQALAHFINRFDFDQKSYDSKALMAAFIKQLNEKNQLHIDTLTDFSNICDSLRLIKPETDCNYNCYVAFLKDDDAEKERWNIDNYFGPFSRQTIQDAIDETILPSGNIEFTSSNVKIALPEKCFKSEEDEGGEAIEFTLHDLKYSFRYDFSKSSYYMVIELVARRSSCTSAFNFKSMQHDFFADKLRKETVHFKKDQLESIIIHLYPTYYEMMIKEPNNEAENQYGFAYNYYKPIKFKTNKKARRSKSKK
jgi:hypothetical protein